MSQEAGYVVTAISMSSPKSQVVLSNATEGNQRACSHLCMSFGHGRKKGVNYTLSCSRRVVYKFAIFILAGNIPPAHICVASSKPPKISMDQLHQRMKKVPLHGPFQFPSSVLITPAIVTFPEVKAFSTSLDLDNRGLCTGLSVDMSVSHHPTSPGCIIC